MKRRLLLLSIFFSLIALNDAQGQTLYLHGGAGFPRSSTFDATHLAGVNAGIGVGIPLSSRFEFLFLGTYDRFGTNHTESRPFSSYSTTAHLKWRPLMTATRLRPYAMAGAGNFMEVEGPFAFELGLSFSAGLSVRTSPQTRFEIEPNYLLVFTEGENRMYVPVRLGVAYSLR